MIDTLISTITAKVGISDALARKAVGMILGYAQRAGDAGAMAKVIAGIPGAADLVAQFSGAEAAAAEGGTNTGGGGLMGSVMGAVSSLTGGNSGGGAMAIAQTLMSDGMEMGQVQQVATETFAFAEQHVDPATVEEAKNSIPGLSAIL